jgi:hypothetical protein
MTGRRPRHDGHVVVRNVLGTPVLQPACIDGVRYRSYVVRVWLTGTSEPTSTRIRVEWIASGIEAEERGARAADLAAQLDRIVDPELAEDDRRAGDEVEVSDRGRN